MYDCKFTNIMFGVLSIASGADTYTVAAAAADDVVNKYNEIDGDEDHD